MIAKLLARVIRLYQLMISPLLGNVCRFYPSCSEYAVICLRRFGAIRGSVLAVGRICRCHPFHPGGVDLPPALPGSGHEARSGEP